MEELQKNFRLGEAKKEVLRKQYGDDIVFTDTCDIPQFRQLDSDELLPGELSAVVFTVGCYTVRSARRVYRIHEPGYSPKKEKPADEDEVGEVGKSLESDLWKGNFLVCHSQAMFDRLPSWLDKLRVTHEISARHNTDPDGAFADGFQYVCRAAQDRNFNWSESIGCIGALKEDASLSDGKASLVVLNTYSGSSFSVSNWYKLDSHGILSNFSIHPFDE